MSFGTIENSQHIDIYSPDFISQINQLNKDKPTIIYCAAGGRSAQASEIFLGEGFMEVYDLTGGYREWKAEGR